MNYCILIVYCNSFRIDFKMAECLAMKFSFFRRGAELAGETFPFSKFSSIVRIERSNEFNQITNKNCTLSEHLNSKWRGGKEIDVSKSTMKSI